MLPTETSGALADELAAVEFVQSQATAEEARPTVAQSDDVSLALPEDINQELLDGLLTELPLHTSKFSDSIQSIVSGHGSLADIDIAKRAAHTLKGAANTVGVRGIANLTHHLEDILVVLSDHGVLPNLGLSQALSYAADCLEGMSEALVGAGDPPGDAIDVLQDIINWANRIDRDGVEAAEGERATHAAPLPAPAMPEAQHAAVPTLRVPTPLLDELLRLVGETMTSTAQIQNRLRLTMQQARAISQQNAMFLQLAGELETLVDLRGIAMPQQVTAERGFDALEFEQFSEIQTVTRRLTEVATDSREMELAAEEHLSALGELLDTQGRLHLENQNAVIRMRMVPVSTVVSRLQRGVRQACRLLDKQATLDVIGADTLIDGNVLNELIDALMHVLRNAVDHGIESEEQRTIAGKGTVGHIELSFKREGDHITVRCRDDGAGLDRRAIRVTAERKGMLDPGQPMPDDQLARLILVPGFSTRDDATQVSGRGIGMDAVNTKVLELKGSLNLRSERGQGLTVEIRLPTTLLSTHALLVRMRNRVIAVSTRGIEDIHYVAAEQLQQLGNRVAYRHGDELHDVVQLEQLLNLAHDRREAQRSGRPMLIVRLDSGAARGVIVQEVIESRSLVVKKLGRYVREINGVLGASILGDGSVAPVVDLPELLRAPALTQAGADVTKTQTVMGLNTEFLRGTHVEQPKALIVDDSISARRSTARVAKDAGFDVRTASDGLEAVAILERMVPDVILTDMEMPRMNGLELTSHIRAREVTKNVPVIMITSRSTERHRKQAEATGVSVYLTKPFSEELLVKHLGTLLREKS